MHPGTSDAAAVVLRPITDADHPLLLLIYAGTRVEEMMALDWSPEERGAFLRQQFQAQHMYYQEHFPAAAFAVILVDDQPAGRLYVDRREQEIRIIDIALLPEYRGRGLGSRIMHDLLFEAAGRKQRVRIHVDLENQAARRLYHRLGFHEVKSDAGPAAEHVYQLMEWSPIS